MCLRIRSKKREKITMEKSKEFKFFNGLLPLTPSLLASSTQYPDKMISYYPHCFNPIPASTSCLTRWIYVSFMSPLLFILKVEGKQGLDWKNGKKIIKILRLFNSLWKREWTKGFQDFNTSIPFHLLLCMSSQEQSTSTSVSCQFWGLDGMRICLPMWCGVCFPK